MPRTPRERSDLAVRGATEAPRVFFVHVMKTGGISLTTMLQGQYPPDACYPRLGGRGLGAYREAVKAKAGVDELLGLESPVRAGIRFYSVHMPAWVAGEVAPDALTLTVLRDPVARTISHLRQIVTTTGAPDDIEEAYADPALRSKLADYQTRMFAESREDHEKQVAAREARVKASLARASQPPDAATVARAIWRSWATAVRSNDRPTEADLPRALSRLDAIDVVGTTDRLDLVRLELEARMGRPLAPLERRNVTPEHQDAPAPLVDQIRSDMRLDEALYNRARVRAGH